MRLVVLRCAARSLLRLPRQVLVNLADWQWKQGNLPAGRQAFEIAHRADPNALEKMDVYAHVLVAQVCQQPCPAYHDNANPPAACRAHTTHTRDTHAVARELA